MCNKTPNIASSRRVCVLMLVCANKDHVQQQKNARAASSKLPPHAACGSFGHVDQTHLIIGSSDAASIRMI